MGGGERMEERERMREQPNFKLVQNSNYEREFHKIHINKELFNP